MRLFHLAALVLLVPLLSFAYVEDEDVSVTVQLTDGNGQRWQPIPLPLSELVGWSNFVLRDEQAFVGKHVFDQPETITHAEIVYASSRTTCTFATSKSRVRRGFFTASRPFDGSLEDVHEFSCLCLV